MALKRDFNLLNMLFGKEPSQGTLPEPLARLGRFCYLVFQDFNRNRCPQKAAALGFETIFSLVPTIVLSLFFVRSVGGLSSLSRDIPHFLLRQLNADEIHLTIPQTGSGGPDIHVKLSDKIQELIDAADLALRSNSLSLISLFGLIMAAMTMALTLERSLNDIWGGGGQRSLIQRVALYWGILTLGPFLVVLSIYVGRRLHTPTGFGDLFVRMLGPIVALHLLYRLVPTTTVHKRNALLGAAVAAAAWEWAKFAFGLYLRHAVGYGKLYGHLGLLPIFLLWVWVGWIIVLGGAEVAYTFQNLSWLTAIERRRRVAPFVQPGLAALNLVLHAGRVFRAGQGPVGSTELAEAAGLSSGLWETLKSALVARRILVEAGPNGEGLLPGRPLEMLRVEEIFSAVEDDFVSPSEGHAALRDLSARLSEARRRELGTKSVAELLG
jgi:membrane protein